MSAIKRIVEESKKRAEVDEFLQYELGRAGYGGVEISKTPIGTRLTIYAVRPSMVIGRGGEGIRALAKSLEDNYKLFNPQIAVAEVPIPELNPQIMAAKIASSLERGTRFRRACHWALQNIMNAGALGAEIIIGGKLTTERARHEKFKQGYIPKVGDPAIKQVRRAVVDTQLKPGLFGIQVVIVPPNYKSPDRIEIKPVEAVTPVAPAEAPKPATVAAPSGNEPQPETEEVVAEAEKTSETEVKEAA